MDDIDDIRSTNDVSGVFDIEEEDPYHDDYMNDRSHKRNENNTRNNNIIDKVKSWFNGRSLTQSRLNKLQNRGIPLYDLDENGNHLEFDPVPFPDVTNNSNETIDPLERFYYKENIFTRHIKLIITVLILLSLLVYLIIEIVKTTKNNSNNQYKNGIFNPTKVYSNGTHSFYPLTFVINVRYLSKYLISKDAMPFLHSFYENDSNSNNDNNNNNNNTIIGTIQPGFPPDSIVQDWNMMTGQDSIHHGIIGDKIWDWQSAKSFEVNLNNTFNLSKPIWTEINEGFKKGKFKTSLFGWNHYIDDNITYTNEKITKSDDKFKEMVKLIDTAGGITERPQLNLISIEELKEFIDRDGNEIGIEMNRVLHDIDKQLRKFFYEIRHRNLSNFTNIIIVSDNGLLKNKENNKENNKEDNKENNNNNNNVNINKVTLQDLLGGKDKYNHKYKKHIDGITRHGSKLTSIISLRIKDTIIRNEIFKELQNGIKSMGGTDDEMLIKTFVKNKFPKEFNFNSRESLINQRIDDIWLVPVNGNRILLQGERMDNGKENDSEFDQMFNNGYIFNDTEAIFIGHGPYFEYQIGREVRKELDTELIMQKKPYEYEKFKNIAVYDIICNLIGLSERDRKDNRDEYALKFRRISREEKEGKGGDQTRTQDNEGEREETTSHMISRTSSMEIVSTSSTSSSTSLSSTRTKTEIETQTVETINKESDGFDLPKEVESIIDSIEDTINNLIDSIKGENNRRQ